MKTFGDCREAGDYEGGFFNTSFGGSYSAAPVDIGMGFNLGTGLDLEKMNRALKEARVDAKTAKLFDRHMEELFKFSVVEAQKDHKLALTSLALSGMVAPVIAQTFLVNKDIFNSAKEIFKKLEEKKNGLNAPTVPSNYKYQNPTPTDEVLSYYHDPMQRLLTSFYKKKGSSEQMSSFKLFFDKMLKGDDNKLGGGFLGTCHAVSLNASVGKSFPSASPVVAFSAGVGYTKYHNGFDININKDSVDCIVKHGIVNSIVLGTGLFGDSCNIVDLKSNMFKECSKATAEAVKDFGETGFLIASRTKEERLYKTPTKYTDHYLDDAIIKVSGKREIYKKLTENYEDSVHLSLMKHQEEASLFEINCGL